MNWSTTKKIYMTLLLIGILLSFFGLALTVVAVVGILAMIQGGTALDLTSWTMYTTMMMYLAIIEIGAILMTTGYFIVIVITYLLFDLVFGGLKEIKKALRGKKNTPAVEGEMRGDIS